jgi:ABC-2 type transport system permease protein
MEVVLEGQESTGEDSGLYMTFAGEIPDFIRADAKAAHVTEWEVND